MKLMSWNVRGMNSAPKRALIKGVILSCKRVCFFMECPSNGGDGKELTQRARRSRDPRGARASLEALRKEEERIRRKSWNKGIDAYKGHGFWELTISRRMRGFWPLKGLGSLTKVSRNHVLSQCAQIGISKITVNPLKFPKITTYASEAPNSVSKLLKYLNY